MIKISEKYSKQIENLTKKYEENLKTIYQYKENNILNDEIIKSLEKEKNQKLNEFKTIIVSNFENLEKEVQKKSREIIIQNFPLKVQQKIKDNEVKYFDKIPGETKEEHTIKMKNQFKALLMFDYCNNAKNKITSEMLKKTPALKTMVDGIVEARYINIFSKSRDKINELKEDKIFNLMNKVHNDYKLEKTQEELNSEIDRDYVKIEIPVKNAANDNELKTRHKEPSFGNFIFKSAETLLGKAKEILQGISRYFMM